MKKIIKPAVNEEYELLCDVSGKPAVACLIMSFGYGSMRDMDRLYVDLSSEVAEEVLRHLQSKYPQFQPVEMREGFQECPLCHR